MMTLKRMTNQPCPVCEGAGETDYSGLIDSPESCPLCEGRKMLTFAEYLDLEEWFGSPSDSDPNTEMMVN